MPCSLVSTCRTLMGLVKTYVTFKSALLRADVSLYTHRYPQLVGVRICLGTFEAGLGCGVYYM